MSVSRSPRYALATVILRIGKFFVLLAAVQILGGHWAVLQSMAWAQMLVDYSRRDSLTVAVGKTFDGAHPCSLCVTVSAGRQEEKKQEATTTVVKLDAVLAPAVQLPPRSEVPRMYFPVTLEACTVVGGPVSPPPRRA